MTLKFNGFKAKRNFHTILNFVLFQKYEMYENKYRTKICDFTVHRDRGRLTVGPRASTYCKRINFHRELIFKGSSSREIAGKTHTF